MPFFIGALQPVVAVSLAFDHEARRIEWTSYIEGFHRCDHLEGTSFESHEEPLSYDEVFKILVEAKSVGSRFDVIDRETPGQLFLHLFASDRQELFGSPNQKNDGRSQFGGLEEMIRAGRPLQLATQNAYLQLNPNLFSQAEDCNP